MPPIARFWKRPWATGRCGPPPPSEPEAGLVLLQEAHGSGDPFSLMVVDCHMPDMDGFMLVEELRKIA